MRVVKHVNNKIQQKVDKYKNREDPKWLHEVLAYDDNFKDFGGWQQVYEPPEPVLEEEPQPKKKTNKLVEKIQQNTVHNMLKPVKQSIKEKALQMFLEALSAGFQAAENHLTQRDYFNLGQMMNALNALVLSFRFQKSFKYVQDSKQEWLLSDQFNENSQKMHYFRKVAVKKFLTYFNAERKEVESKIIAEMVEKGITLQHAQKIQQQVHQNVMAAEEALKFRIVVQQEMERRVREKIMTTLEEKKKEIESKIEQHEFFQLRGLLSQQLGVEVYTPEQKQLVEHLIESGLNQILEIIFTIATAQLDKIFTHVEEVLNKVLMILNGIAISDQAIDDITDQISELNEMADEVSSDKMAKQVLDSLESSYQRLHDQIHKYIQSFFHMIQSMMTEEEDSAPEKKVQDKLKRT